MTIPLVKESEEIREEFPSTIECCVFCKQQTIHWHEDTNSPVCQDCAEKHDVVELMFPESDKRPQKGWWAPGNYTNTCNKCHLEFTGDKRAGCCAPCAYGDTE